MNKKMKKVLCITLFCLGLFTFINNVSAADGYSIDVVECGGSNNMVPAGIASITRTIYGIIKYGVPVLIIIFAIVDLVKAIIAGEESKMKEGTNKFIKRLISGIVVLLVFTIVQFVFSLFFEASNKSGSDVGVDDNSLMECISCFLFDKNSCPPIKWNYEPEDGDGEDGSYEDPDGDGGEHKEKASCYLCSGNYTKKKIDDSCKQVDYSHCESSNELNACYWNKDSKKYQWISNNESDRNLIKYDNIKNKSVCTSSCLSLKESDCRKRDMDCDWTTRYDGPQKETKCYKK